MATKAETIAGISRGTFRALITVAIFIFTMWLWGENLFGAIWTRWAMDKALAQRGLNISSLLTDCERSYIFERREWTSDARIACDFQDRRP